MHRCNTSVRSADDSAVPLNSTCTFDCASRHWMHVHECGKGIWRSRASPGTDALRVQPTLYRLLQSLPRPEREASVLWSVMQVKYLTFEPTCVKSRGQRWAGRERRAAENDARPTQTTPRLAEQSWASPRQIPHLEIKLYLDFFFF